MATLADSSPAPACAPAAVPADMTLLRLLGVLDGGLLVADTTNRIIVANDALPAAFGSSRPAIDIIGVTLAELRLRDPYLATPALWQDLPAVPGRYQVAMPDGRVAVGAWHPLVLGDGSEGRALVVTDVTGDVLVRRRLREHNRALAELVATKTELVSALLHELRTPLTAMSAMLELAHPSGDAAIDGVLEVLTRNTARLSAVVQEITTISGLETHTGDVAHEPVDVETLVVDGVARWAGVAGPEVRLTAEVTGGPFVHGDAGWLTQMIDRLLAVAVSTAPPGAVITVLATPDDDGWLLGIPLTAERITDQLFTSSHGRSNATALMLARAVVARHDGALRIATRAGRPEFEVRLPYRAPAAATGATAALPHGDRQGPTAP